MGKRNIPIQCEVCGGSGFATRHDLNIGKGRFCSKKCSNSRQQKVRLKKNCEGCGTEFDAKPFLLNIGKEKFCSKKCSYENREAIPPVERLMKYTYKQDNWCWLWYGSKNSHGYGQLGPTKGRSRSAHILSYEEFVGTIPKGMYVLHKCDVPNCIRPDHLFLGTAQDNTDDMVAKGRDHFGPNKKYITKEDKIIGHRLACRRYYERKKIREKGAA